MLSFSRRTMENTTHNDCVLLTMFGCSDVLSSNDVIYLLAKMREIRQITWFWQWHYGMVVGRSVCLFISAFLLFGFRFFQTICCSSWISGCIRSHFDDISCKFEWEMDFVKYALCWTVHYDVLLLHFSFWKCKTSRLFREFKRLTLNITTNDAVLMLKCKQVNWSKPKKMLTFV